jgi:hypothetical protein
MQAIHRLDQGIELRFDDTEWTAPGAAATCMWPAKVGATGASALVAGRALASGVARCATPLTFERTPAARSRAQPAHESPVVRVPLQIDEDAALLVEAEGFVSWQFPDGVEPAGAAARLRHPGAMREARFTLAEPGRAWVRPASGAWSVDSVDATVLTFLARGAAGGVVRKLEHAQREGPVVVNDVTDAARWEQPDAFPFVRASRNAATPILLFLHGTLSTVRGAFGELTATAWGQSFLEAARRNYAATWGWDHRTLAHTPRQNAEALCAALQALTLARPPAIDIVCHGRGALVARSLVEEVLPGKAWRPAVRRVIFVGGTNAGTPLACPEHWRTFIDLHTNLALAMGGALEHAGAPALPFAVEEAIDGVVDLVAHLLRAGLEDDAAPGLAAVDPQSAFVRSINALAARAPAADACEYYAIASSFEPRAGEAPEPPEFPRRLRLMLARGYVDELMRQVPNDLMVDVPSMTASGIPSCEPREVLDFGFNAAVYHTNYFLQRASADAIARWLGLAAPEAPPATERARETQATHA